MLIFYIVLYELNVHKRYAQNKHILYAVGTCAISMWNKNRSLLVDCLIAAQEFNGISEVSFERSVRFLRRNFSFIANQSVSQSVNTMRLSLIFICLDQSQLTTFKQMDRFTMYHEEKQIMCYPCLMMWVNVLGNLPHLSQSSLD